MREDGRRENGREQGKHKISIGPIDQFVTSARRTARVSDKFCLLSNIGYANHSVILDIYIVHNSKYSYNTKWTVLHYNQAGIISKRRAIRQGSLFVQLYSNVNSTRTGCPNGKAAGEARMLGDPERSNSGMWLSGR